MKKPLYTIGYVLAIGLLFQNQLLAQTQEKGIEKTPVAKKEYTDDLAPFPYGKAPEEKKTLGQKIKENLDHQNVPVDTVSKEDEPEGYIRFYEFKDITFADREGEVEDAQARPIDNYIVTEDEFDTVDDYYEDVTFKNKDESDDMQEKAYDDQAYTPYRYKLKEDASEEKKYYKTGNENVSENKPDKILPPIEIKGKDFYRQDYIRYYDDRKKKGSVDPSVNPDYSDEIKKAKKRIYDRISENRNDRKN